MRQRHASFRACTRAVVLVVAAVTANALGGPLDPPAGPIASTAKPLGEVEPRIAINAANTPGDADSLFAITQPGSYYLTGNVVGVVGKHGIKVSSSGVTIDLSGFELRGPQQSGSFFDGVSVSNGFTDIAVVSGSVRGWGSNGVDLELATACHVERVRAIANAGYGIKVGDESLVTACVCRDNGFTGIVAGESATIADCTSSVNRGHGIVASFSSTIARCTTYFNSVGGIVATKSTITACTVSGNSSTGIEAQNASLVESCSVSDNSGDGIQVLSGCLVRACNCQNNGFGGGSGANIEVFNGSDNRIEGNNCTGADTGIRVVAAGNIIVRNTCSGNTTNWIVAAGNVCLVVSAATSGAINGNFGGVAPGSADPSANFTY